MKEGSFIETELLVDYGANGPLAVTTITPLGMWPSEAALHEDLTAWAKTGLLSAWEPELGTFLVMKRPAVSARVMRRRRIGLTEGMIVRGDWVDMQEASPEAVELVEPAPAG